MYRIFLCSSSLLSFRFARCFGFWVLFLWLVFGFAPFDAFAFAAAFGSPLSFFAARFLQQQQQYIIAKRRAPTPAPAAKRKLTSKPAFAFFSMPCIPWTL